MTSIQRLLVLGWLLTATSLAAADAINPFERDAVEGVPVGYGLMMDAGSTGSRVHVYRWVWRGDDKLPTITDDFFKQVKPGLSALSADPKIAAASLQPLLDYALTVMPPDAVKDTWVQLFATAGLRLLPKDTQDGLLEAVRDTLQASPFIFQRGSVAIASGVNEAVDAWVSANYILGGATATNPHETVGTIDLGGGSVQVCTRTDIPERDIPADQLFELSLGGVDTRLYAKSHLAYGLNEMRKRIDKMVEAQVLAIAAVNPTPGAGIVHGVQHPCLMKGDTLTFSEAASHVNTAKGTSNFEKCLAMMRRLGEDCMHIPTEDCQPMSTVGKPKFNGKFLAFSYFHDVLPEFVTGDEPTLAAIKTTTLEVCNTPLAELKAAHPDYETNNPEFIRRACQDLTYFVYILGDHLQFAENEKRIQIVKQINGKEMSWTLGATLRMLKKPLPKSEL